MPVTMSVRYEGDDPYDHHDPRHDPHQVDECIGCGEVRPIVVSLGPDVRYCAECVEKDV